MSKKVEVPIKVMNALDATANQSYTWKNAQYVDNVGISVTFTGTPSGTLTIQGSVDGIDFVTLPNTSTTISAAGTTLFDLNQLSFPFVQINWAESGGSVSPTITAWLTAKNV